jgi:DNA-binding LytR/AlgR family response regulator
MYKAIIIEDEYLLANVIENYLSEEATIELVDKFENPLDGLKFLHSNAVDLVFLDIQMPMLSGVDLAKMIPKDVAVIFTTAYSEYAIEGFELNALDYLLKPVTLSRFKVSISRFLESKQLPNAPVSITNNKSSKFITVKADGGLHKIDLSNLLYIESLREYLRYCTSQDRYVVYGSLAKAAQELLEHGFIRIHKSVIVNKKFITTISGNQIFLGKDISFNIGRSYKPTLMKEIQM